MALNIFLFLFCISIAWLLFRFSLRKSVSIEDYRKLILFYSLLIIFLLFNTFMAFLGSGGLKLAQTETPLTTLAEINTLDAEDGVILNGKISPQNNPLWGDYIAYIDDQSLKSPMELWIELKDGQIAITNSNYQAVKWLVDARDYSYLQANQPVIAVGYIEIAADVSGGEKYQSIRAEIIYAGDLEDFRMQARIKGIAATAMMVLNLVAAVIIFVIPLLDCIRGQKTIPPEG